MATASGADDSRPPGRSHPPNRIRRAGLVVGVVIGFLLGIIAALDSVNTALGEAEDAVTGVRGDVRTLPDNIAGVNTTLRHIDAATEPLDRQAQEIAGDLRSIRTSLPSVDGSLEPTSAELKDTERILADTADTLGGVRSLAAQVKTELVQAQRPDSLGSEGIWKRVATANSVLTPIQRDTGDIVRGLEEVNRHLTSICQALPSAGEC